MILPMKLKNDNNLDLSDIFKDLSNLINIYGIRQLSVKLKSLTATKGIESDFDEFLCDKIIIEALKVMAQSSKGKKYKDDPKSLSPEIKRICVVLINKYTKKSYRQIIEKLGFTSKGTITNAIQNHDDIYSSTNEKLRLQNKEYIDTFNEFEEKVKVMVENIRDSVLNDELNQLKWLHSLSPKELVNLQNKINTLLQKDHDKN